LIVDNGLGWVPAQPQAGLGQFFSPLLFDVAAKAACPVGYRVVYARSGVKCCKYNVMTGIDDCISPGQRIVEFTEL
jgi:hypothetical protein